jgi:hypothetical protein
LEASLKASNEVNGETAAANADFKKVLEFMQAFRNNEYFWGKSPNTAAGTTFWVDPKEDLTVLFMIQRLEQVFHCGKVISTLVLSISPSSGEHQRGGDLTRSLPPPHLTVISAARGLPKPGRAFDVWLPR